MKTRPAFRDNGKTYKGEFLMAEGLRWYLRDAVSSSVLELTEVN